MLWEETKPEQFVVPDDILDLSFKIDCPKIALDHAEDLSAALHQALPWFGEEDAAGLHLIHGASTGNGWQRPDAGSGEDFIYLSKRRARMQLRVPKERIDDSRELTGQTLQVGEYRIIVGTAETKPLTNIGTIFSRYIRLLPDEAEEDFMQRMLEQLRDMNIQVKKMMCGIGHQFQLQEGLVETVSLMLADLEPQESVRLQQKGLGDDQKRGFGLFIPHKGIKPVGNMEDQSHFSGT